MTAYQRFVSTATVFGFAVCGALVFAAAILSAFLDVEGDRLVPLFVVALVGLIVGGVGVVLSMLYVAGEADGPSAKVQLQCRALPEIERAKSLLPGLRAQTSCSFSFDGLDVGINYVPGDPGVRTFPNGDPGYPPTGPDVEVVYAYVEDGDELADTFGARCAWIPDGLTRYDDHAQRLLWADAVLLPDRLLDELGEDSEFYDAACDAIASHEDGLAELYAGGDE